VRDVPRLVWVLAAGRFVNAAGSFLAVFLFLYLTGPRGLSIGHAGLLSGGLGAGLLIGNLTGGRFGDRYGHRRVMLLASTVVGVCTLAVPWTPAWALAGSLPLLGYTAATSGVSQGALAALAVPAGDRRRAVAGCGPLCARTVRCSCCCQRSWSSTWSTGSSTPRCRSTCATTGRASAPTPR
jgi:predicted MFS family arabinose efflux permease